MFLGTYIICPYILWDSTPLNLRIIHLTLVSSMSLANIFRIIFCMSTNKIINRHFTKGDLMNENFVFYLF